MNKLNSATSCYNIYQRMNEEHSLLTRRNSLGHVSAKERKEPTDTIIHTRWTPELEKQWGGKIGSDEKVASKKHYRAIREEIKEFRIVDGKVFEIKRVEPTTNARHVAKLVLPQPAGKPLLQRSCMPWVIGAGVCVLTSIGMTVLKRFTDNCEMIEGRPLCTVMSTIPIFVPLMLALGCLAMACGKFFDDRDLTLEVKKDKEMEDELSHEEILEQLKVGYGGDEELLKAAIANPQEELIRLGEANQSLLLEMLDLLTEYILNIACFAMGHDEFFDDRYSAKKNESRPIADYKQSAERVKSELDSLSQELDKISAKYPDIEWLPRARGALLLFRQGVARMNEVTSQEDPFIKDWPQFLAKKDEIFQRIHKEMQPFLNSLMT